MCVAIDACNISQILISIPKVGKDADTARSIQALKNSRAAGVRTTVNKVRICSSWHGYANINHPL